MNQVAVEALYSATYVENYLDSVENLPDDAQKFFSRIRELDIQYRNFLRDANQFYEQWSNCPTSELESANGSKRSRAMTRMQQSLIAARELSDEKMQLAQALQELIDHKVRQLEHDFKNLDYGQDELMQTDLPKDPYQYTHSASPVPNSPSGVVLTGNTFNSSSQAFLSSMACNGSGSGGSGNAAMVSGNGERHSSSNSSHNGSSANGGYGGGSVGGGGGSGRDGAGGNTGSGSGKRARRVRTDAADMGSSDSNLENNGKGSSYGNSSMNMASGSSQQQQQQNQQQNQGNRKGQQAVNNSGKKKKRKTRVQAGTAAGGMAASGGAGSSSSNNTNNASSSNLSALHTSGRDMRDDTPPQEDTIDPDEPTYCLCDQISFGEMILCDNDLCPIEWFHFSCVSLISKPKGKWYCPNCRGDRPNIMKNKAQFLKELERYNKEREEKT